MGVILRHFLHQTLPETLPVATFLALKVSGVPELTTSPQICRLLASSCNRAEVRKKAMVSPPTLAVCRIPYPARIARFTRAWKSARDTPCFRTDPQLTDLEALLNLVPREIRHDTMGAKCGSDRHRRTGHPDQTNARVDQSIGSLMRSKAPIAHLRPENLRNPEYHAGPGY